MRKRSGLGALVAFAATSWLVAGCDTTSVEGSPTGTSTAMNAGLFEPCDIPAEALRAAGVDPASKEPDVFGVQRTGWEVCGWTASWYYLSVFSTEHSFDEVKSNPNSTDFRPASVPGRDAVSSRETAYPVGELCDISFATSEGTVIVRASKKGGVPAQEDPCVVAERSAVSLNNVLPR